MERGNLLSDDSVRVIQETVHTVRHLTRGRVPMRRRRHDATATAAANNTPVWIKITGVHSDSPTGETDTRVFTGSRYETVSGAAVQTGVTIIIANMPAGTSSFPSHFLPAIPADRSWTNAEGKIVTETVYEAFMFNLWGEEE